MTTALIIEDEPRNVALLEALIQQHCAHMVTVKGNAGNIRDAFELIKEEKPGILYLDIELSDGSAFDLLDQFEEMPFRVIFVTAFNEYAVKAFRLNAVDYLLKPISSAELIDATRKAIARNSEEGESGQLLKSIRQLALTGGTSRVAINVADGILYLKQEEIVRIEAKANYCIIFLSNGRSITCIKTLKELEEMLPEHIFLRVHHSWIINTNYLKKYHRNKNGYIEMEDGSTVAISVRKKEKLLTFFNRKE